VGERDGLKICVSRADSLTLVACPWPEPVEQDSRGILDPWLLRQRVRLTRYPASPTLSGLIDRFWAVEWDLPERTVHSQQVLTHPGANLTVGHADARMADHPPGHIEARLNGVARELTTRVLIGRGWTVAAMTTPGGLGAFLIRSASAFTDRAVPLGQVLGIDEELLVERTAVAEDPSARVAVLAAALEDVLAAADPREWAVPGRWPSWVDWPRPTGRCVSCPTCAPGPVSVRGPCSGCSCSTRAYRRPGCYADTGCWRPPSESETDNGCPGPRSPLIWATQTKPT